MSSDLYAERPLDEKELEAEFAARKEVWLTAKEQPIEPTAPKVEAGFESPGIDLKKVTQQYVACKPEDVPAVVKACWPTPREGFTLLAQPVPTNDGRVAWFHPFSDEEVLYCQKRLDGIAEVGPVTVVKETSR